MAGNALLQGVNFDNLFIINYTSLQNILTQVVAAVRENSSGIFHHIHKYKSNSKYEL